MEEIKANLSTSSGTLEAINKATAAAEEFLAEQDSGTVEVEVVSRTGVAARIFSLAPALLSSILFTLILLFFLVAFGDMFLNKTIASMIDFTGKRRTVGALYSIEEQLGRHLGGIALINFGLGGTVANYYYGLPNNSLKTLNWVLNDADLPEPHEKWTLVYIDASAQRVSLTHFSHKMM